MKKYIQTREELEKIIKETAHVCDRCGSKLSAIETVDNSNNPTHWSGCEPCGVFTAGQPETVFKLAVKLHDHYRLEPVRNFRGRHEMGKELLRKDNISTLCRYITIIYSELKEERDGS